MEALTITKGKYSKVPAYPTIKHALEVIQDNENKACLCTIYATAARAGEILGSERTYYRTPAPVFDKGLNHFIQEEKYKTKSVIPALTFSGIHFDKDAMAIQFSIYVAKRRKKIYRQSFVNRESEEWLFDILFNYFFHIDDNGNVLKNGFDNEVCFKLGYPETALNKERSRRRKARNIFLKEINRETNFGGNLHLLRHARISHKLNNFGYTSLEIFDEILWATLEQSLTYSHIESKAHEKMQKKPVV